MIEQAVDELTPIVGTQAACQALGAAPATIYRRRRPPEHFTCPFCASWSARVASLLQEFPAQIQIVSHHFPLSVQSQSQSLPAAIAAECADQQGMFAAFKHALLTEQALFGSKPWNAFAHDAAVPDLQRFRDCAALPMDSFPRIAYGVDGMELGRRTGVRGTPTVWVHGFVQRPDLDELGRLVRDAQK